MGPKVVKLVPEGGAVVCRRSVCVPSSTLPFFDFPFIDMFILILSFLFDFALSPDWSSPLGDYDHELNRSLLALRNGQVSPKARKCKYRRVVSCFMGCAGLWPS